MSASDIRIEISNLVVDYGEVRAVDDVSLSVARGELVTSVCHVPVQLDAIAAELVQLLDGSRTREQVVGALAKVEGAPQREDVERGLPGSLQWLAHMGLLEA